VCFGISGKERKIRPVKPWPSRVPSPFRPSHCGLALSLCFHLLTCELLVGKVLDIATVLLPSVRRLTKGEGDSEVSVRQKQIEQQRGDSEG
jgi:hypothetical protein